MSEQEGLSVLLPTAGIGVGAAEELPAQDDPRMFPATPGPAPPPPFRRRLRPSAQQDFGGR